MEISVEERPQAIIVAPHGDVDMSCSRDLQARLRAVLQKGPKALVVDLASVPYMDSSGVATLVEAMQIARRQSTTLVLAGMKDKVRSIFEIARLDRVFSIVDDLDQALAE